MAKRNRPILPGLSRSTACTATKSCGRLDGHHGDCRPTLTATTVKAPTKSVATKRATTTRRRATTRKPKAAVRWTKDTFNAFRAAVAIAVGEDAIAPSEGLALMADAITEQAAQNSKRRAARLLAAGA